MKMYKYMLEAPVASTKIHFENLSFIVALQSFALWAYNPKSRDPTP